MPGSPPDSKPALSLSKGGAGAEATGGGDQSDSSPDFIERETQDNIDLCRATKIDSMVVLRYEGSG